MIKKLAALILLFPAAALGWNETDHQAMARLALSDVAASWKLNQKVPVRPLQSLLDKLQKLRPELGDAWHFSDYLKINSKINLEHEDPAVEGKRLLSPLDILSFYSTDPDDGRDQNLFVRDKKGNPQFAYPDQKWFGVLQGPDSQAFRHIEKPPFRFRSAASTFGLPFRTVGEATERAEIYFQVSLLAFSLNEEYWGWRFLAGSFHYLQDLHQPYHAGQITFPLLLKCVEAYFSWGRKEKGLVGTCAHLVSNSHRFYENYVAAPQGFDRGAKEKALETLRGEDLLSFTSTVRDLAIQVRDASNLRFPELVSAVTQATTPALLTPHRFEKEDWEKEPEKFLKQGPAFEEANHKMFEVTKERFESAGRMIRTVVGSSLKNRGKSEAGEILEELDQLLYPTSS
jgi:hypothetical protein